MISLKSVCNIRTYKNILILSEKYCVGLCNLNKQHINSTNRAAYCTSKGNEPPDDSKPTQTDPSPIGFDSKYITFKDADAPVLLDVYEEKIQLEKNNTLNVEEDEYHGINLERGTRGVFDIEELVNLLRKEQAQDIFVAQLPPEAQYVDQIVVISGKSRRHILALAETVRKVYKKKRWSSDRIPNIEGGKSAEWLALDLGNIALHIFSQNTRVVYDLESLWSVGPLFDPLVNKPEDPLISLLNKHTIPISDLSDRGQLQ